MRLPYLMCVLYLQPVLRLARLARLVEGPYLWRIMRLARPVSVLHLWRMMRLLRLLPSRATAQLTQGNNCDFGV